MNETQLLKTVLTLWKETLSFMLCQLDKPAHNTLLIFSCPHCRDIQEDLENLYGRRQDLNWQTELPTSHEEWRFFNGQALEQGDHEDYIQSREGDFLQEFEQMFHNIFRGFQFDFNPPAQGPLNLIFCKNLTKRHVSVQSEDNSVLVAALQKCQKLSLMNERQFLVFLKFLPKIALYPC